MCGGIEEAENDAAQEVKLILHPNFKLVNCIYRLVWICATFSVNST